MNGDPLRRELLRWAHRPLHYDRAGEVIDDVMAWAALYEVDDYRRVAFDEVGDAAVSTVWVGLDMRFWPGSPPMIFETMIFGGDHDGAQWRWATEEQARAGHQRVVQRLQRGEDPDE